MKDIVDLDDFTKIIIHEANYKVAVVEFYASWCEPCQTIHTLLEEKSKILTRLTFCRIDVDECSKICDTMNIRCTPTIAFFIAGKRVGSLEGADPIKLEKLLMKYNEI